MHRFFKVNSFVIPLVIAAVFVISNSYAQSDGEKLFKQNCASCHKSNTKQFVGPGLQGMRERQNDDWIIRWTRNSKELIESGDAYAIEIFNKFNKTPMPPQPLQDEEIMAIFDYIDAQAVENAPENNPDITIGDSSDEPKGTDSMKKWLYIILAVVIIGILVMLYKRN